MTENSITCPECGANVSKEDTFCKRCGTRLKKVLEPVEQSESSAVPPSPPPYTRRFGVVQRLYGVFRRPSETMRDIGLVPDYGGVAIVLISQIALMIVSVSIGMSKISITGSYATEVKSMMSSIIAIVMVIGVFLVLLRWIVKSAIVWKACDTGSGWGFGNAFVVTGYAYIADVVVNIIWVVIMSSYVPVLQLNVDNLEAATQALSSYRSQTTLLSLSRLPIAFLALLWKSYLGGIGTHHGTREMCTKATGITVFFLLGLVGLIISLFTTFT